MVSAVLKFGRTLLGGQARQPAPPVVGLPQKLAAQPHSVELVAPELRVMAPRGQAVQAPVGGEPEAAAGVVGANLSMLRAGTLAAAPACCSAEISELFATALTCRDLKIVVCRADAGVQGCSCIIKGHAARPGRNLL